MALTNNTKQTPSLTNNNKRHNVFDYSKFDMSTFDETGITNNAKKTTTYTNNTKN